MIALGLWLLMAVTAGSMTSVIAREISKRGPLQRENYRGIKVPTAGGVSILVGLASAAALGRVLLLASPSSARLAQAVGLSPSVIAAVLGFGLLGLWDDLAGGASERGWEAHMRAIGQRRATSGALKLIGGGAIAIVVAPGPGAGWTVVHALVIALSANLFNLLDLRPGRASKFFIVAALGLAAATGPSTLHLWSGIGAVVAFLVLDLRERVMLGDAGANAIGALIGLGIATTASHVVAIISLSVLIVLTMAGHTPGLSRFITSIPPLRAFDEAGRVHG